ncbi:hypothetical protein XENTR_v10010339 [Xenopus tropicalis]|uniref:Olfactory receptor n=1 Tax=Xenopus tropicalis TaxID=8364 RepID=A0A8J0QUI3_XENTR|nr:olfactory receptor 11L1-like [Xenopus tropicalis]KAE8620580.1 hypothetical protein XENTR_v10010339 [Xenopus tropicalis]
MGSNKTAVTDFFLLGLQQYNNQKFLVFFVLLIMYVTTLTGDLMIILLVSTSQRLQSPMYYFLKHLSMSEIMFTTNIIPNMLYIILKEGRFMSIVCCFIQFYIFIASGSVESLLLTIMSYDRYLAICNPLRYSYLMNLSICRTLVSCSWLLCFMLVLVTVILLGQLQFCFSNIIDHYFCDLEPILELSCSDTSLVRTEVLVLSIPTVIVAFTFIIITYICIFYTVLRITSSAGRHKAFSTCSAHLTSVCSYYGPLIIIYVVPYRGSLLNANKLLSLLYTVVTPLINPIIYSLRNQEIREVLATFWNTKRKH